MSSLRRLGDLVLVRHRRNFILLARFAVVGLSGVVVNMLVLIVANKLGPAHEQAIVGLPFSDFNVRWYHVYSTIAFLVANLWNFQLNRSWTFKTAAACVVGQGVLAVPRRRHCWARPSACWC